MNRDRRNRLKAIDTDELNVLLEAYEVARAALVDCCSEIRVDIEEVMSEEQEAYDNMPESLQESDRGSDMQSNIDAMEEVIDDLDEISSGLDGLSFEGESVEALKEL